MERSYQEKGIPIKIQLARSDNGEKVVYFPTHNGVIHYKLDGYFEIGQDKYACEFYGCNWHGCPKCYIRDRESIVNNGKSLSLRYKETVIKELRLKELGLILITKWLFQFGNSSKLKFKKFCRELKYCKTY